MKKITFTLVILVTSLACAAEAQALPFRTFVSIAGDDANDCTLKTPCRTFVGAVPKTEAGGEITAVDSGTYFGVVTINKALTIQAAPGVYALLAAVATPASPVTVSAGAGDVVVLRNLYVSQMPVKKGKVPTKGIELKSAGALHVESSIVTGVPNAGLFGVGACDSAKLCTPLLIKDSVFRENGAGMNIGSVTASIDHCRIERNGTGVLIQPQSRVTMRGSVVAGNSMVGLDAQEFESITNVENCVVTNNGTGIRAAVVSAGGREFGHTIFYLSATMITGNQTGLAANGGEVVSFTNNRLANNTLDGSFTSTITQQ
ncbi:MAG TPA: right-handed parallel beta-helix repeat-containing protein [Pyrinomonadaceae bacterium]|nr:right-handed parallel beta-helix repeat-containing protein [Pyrinomonadaceae bacterium]